MTAHYGNPARLTVAYLESMTDHDLGVLMGECEAESAHLAMSQTDERVPVCAPCYAYKIVSDRETAADPRTQVIADLAAALGSDVVIFPLGLTGLYRLEITAAVAAKITEALGGPR